MFQGWTKDEIEEYQGKARLIDRVESELAENPSLSRVSVRFGQNRTFLYRLMQAWKMVKESGNHRLLLRGRSSGRPPLCNPSAEELHGLREWYLKSNRGRGRGSKTMAARLFAEQDPRCSDALRSVILADRTSKHSLPKSLMAAMTIAPDVVSYSRSPTTARLGGMYCPGQLRMARDEGDPNRRLRAGDRQSWDDATINFCVVVPWPWGGDRCSDKFGVKVGRFQLLAGIDDASDYCPGFSYVCRPLQSYRAEDSTGAMYRVWRDSYLPRNVMVEGGVWQSHRALNFYRQVGVQPISAKGRPHMKLIESYWNRLWTPLSMLSDGQVGRYRGENERETDLLMKCQRGSMDPREVFPELQVALGAISQGISHLNRTPVHSKQYGSWCPEERHAAEIAEREPMRIEPGLAWTAYPEVHTRITRRGMVTIKVESPLGFPHPYIFACDDLHEFNGRRVTVHFDPYAHPIAATIVLAEDHAGIRAGSIITNDARTMEGAPEVFQASGGWAIEFDPGALQRAIAMRKAQHRIVRTEYRALKGNLALVESVTRAPEIQAEPGGQDLPGVTGAEEDWSHPLQPGRAIRTREQMLEAAG